MKGCEGQISLFDIFVPPKKEDVLPCDFCGYQVQGCCDYPCTPDDYCVLGDKKIPRFSWDTDINVIHNRLVQLVEKHGLSISDDEWSIWSHVPQYGYRMAMAVESDKFTEEFLAELGEIVEYAKTKKIEISPMDAYLGTMHIYSTFEDKERRKRK